MGHKPATQRDAMSALTNSATTAWLEKKCTVKIKQSSNSERVKKREKVTNNEKHQKKRPTFQKQIKKCFLKEAL